MKPLFYILFACIFTLPVFGETETNAPVKEHRFLFIVNTSSAMSRSTNAAHLAILKMIYTGIDGEMRNGDSFGIWTYNRELKTGVFPLQFWHPETKRPLTQFVEAFLRGQRYEKTARATNVIKPLLAITKSSPSLTVIWVSDGHPISGTPFDAPINAIYKKEAHDLREEKLPFVTFLLARDGKFIDYKVNSSLDPWSIPRIPRPKPVPVINPTLTTQTNLPVIKPKRIVEPIVIRGPTRQTNTPPPVAVPISEPAKATPIIQTNLVAEVVPVAIKEEPAPVAVKETFTNSPVVAKEVQPEVKAKPISHDSVASNSAPKTPVPAPAVLIPTHKETSSKNRSLLFGVLFVVTAGIVLFILIRRKSGAGASLISHSMKRDGK